MLLKTADDKRPRLDLLQALQNDQSLTQSQRRWASSELSRLRKGIQGEKDAAHFLDRYFAEGENHVVLHDLRFSFEGETAQIDHLIINRPGMFFLVETKNYAGNLVINDQGEFTVQYGDDEFGIPSPIEQSHRHERLLVKLLTQLGIEPRAGSQPEFRHVVMLHPKAVIQRPEPKLFDTRQVIKADQFPSWHDNFAAKPGLGTFIRAAVNMRSLDTIREWGEKLIRQHRPADLLRLPPFMSERPSPAVKPAPPTPIAVPEVVQQQPEEPPAKKLICATCGKKITYAEGKFCWNNAKRFGGLQYCREHQAEF